MVLLHAVSTLLDELFRLNVTSEDGDSAAKDWLVITEEEGRDVHAYLEQGMALHAGQQFLTLPAWPPELSRQNTRNKKYASSSVV